MFQHKILDEMSLSGKYKAIPEEPLPTEKIIQKVIQDGRTVLNEFQRLFYCYRWPSDSDYIALEFLTDALTEKHLEIKPEFITTPPNLERSLENIGQRGRTVESAEHQGMKLWIMDFLRNKGISATEEVSLLGYEIDVGCIKQNIFVECGDTEAKKIFTILFHGYSIGLLQYDSEYIVWFQPKSTFVDRFAKDARAYFCLARSKKSGLYEGKPDNCSDNVPGQKARPGLPTNRSSR